ncbi:D-alanyl-D-alanine carboxypeptidase/D-alanyl-D-alanine-endopeptidase [Candidatus Sumerlaeota bacterium]|nr:D-alanyl-D-alanine carboxypeptidase/D-alanyl-D-alanine-endopeptidase [Candidatus Sumerlaeota bacterium]
MRKSPSFHLCFLVLLQIILVLGSPSAAQASSAPNAKFKADIDSIVKKGSSKNTNWGIAIRNASTGQSLYEENSLRKLVPASNRKLFTSLLALEKLGEQYTYQTELFADGAISEDGHLRGALRVVGSGDPTFCNPRFDGGSRTKPLEQFVDAVKRAGIKYVHDGIVVDCSAFTNDHDAVSGLPDDYVVQYAARPCCLSFSENAIAVQVKAGYGENQPVRVSTIPAYSLVLLINNAKNGSKRSANTLRISRERNGDIITIDGKKPLGQSSETRLVALRNPALVAGKVFKELLKENGIFVQGDVRVVYSAPEAQGKRLDVYISPPLKDLLPLMNQRSNNVITEQVYQSISRRLYGLGSYENTRKAELEFLDQIGVPIRYVVPEDGSGLSRDNLCTADSIIRMLQWETTQPHFQTFKDSLALSGSKGTLKGRMTSSRLKGRVYGKTGTLNGVSTLSGYYITPKGTIFTFSILVNDAESWKARDAQNIILDKLARYYGHL